MMHFLGREASYWIHVQHVMEKNALRDAKDLEMQLECGKAPQRIAPHAIKIVDAINHRRVLGFLVVDRRRLNPQHNIFEMAVCGPISARMFDPDVDSITSTISRATFEWVWETSEDGWSKHRVGATHTKLGVLMGLREFYLPDENERQQRERLMRGGW